MAIGHHQRGMGMSSRLIDKLTSDRQVMGKVWESHNVNREYDIPYISGHSTDGKTIYVDQHLPDTITFELDGKTHEVRPLEYVLDHERFEKAVREALGWAYESSHEAATGYARRQIVQRGIPWHAFQEALKYFVKKDGLKNVPADLDMQPYYTHPVDQTLVARMDKATTEGKGQPKSEKAAVDYGEGHAASHCGPTKRWRTGDCEHFKGPHGCELVGGYIQPTGWCRLWEPCDDDDENKAG